MYEESKIHINKWKMSIQKGYILYKILEKAKQKEKGSSDSNYGILKSDSDQI